MDDKLIIKNIKNTVMDIDVKHKLYKCYKYLKQNPDEKSLKLLHTILTKIINGKFLQSDESKIIKLFLTLYPEEEDIEEQVIEQEVIEEEKQNNNYKEILNKIYNIDLNFDGATTLLKKAKKIDKNISLNDVKLFLSNQNSYQRTYNKVSKKNHMPIYTEGIFNYQIDLTFLPQFKNSNDGYYILFTAININTRYLYTYNSKSKDMHTILDIFKQFEEDAKEVNAIECDLGGEFKNHEFIKFCDNNNIKIQFFKDDTHNNLGILNRCHRTIKEKLEKYFIAHNTTRWIDVIDKIVKNYNHTYNRGIKNTPDEVNRNKLLEADIIIRKREETIKQQENIPTFKINDIIRVKIHKDTFTKFTPKYSHDLYKITKVNNNTITAVNNKNENHLFKKSNIIHVNNDFEEQKIDTIKEHKRLNNNERKVKLEGLIPEIIDRPKRDRKQKIVSDYGDL